MMVKKDVDCSDTCTITVILSAQGTHFRCDGFAVQCVEDASASNARPRSHRHLSARLKVSSGTIHFLGVSRPKRR